MKVNAFLSLYVTRLLSLLLWTNLYCYDQFKPTNNDILSLACGSCFTTWQLVLSSAKLWQWVGLLKCWDEGKDGEVSGVGVRRTSQSLLFSATHNREFAHFFSKYKRLYRIKLKFVRFQVLTAASMMFRIVFWDVMPCKIIVDRRFRGTYCLHPEHQT
jgi:hypothetical protein